MRLLVLVFVLGLAESAIDPEVQVELNKVKAKQDRVDLLISKISSLLLSFGQESEKVPRIPSTPPAPVFGQRKFEKSGTFIVPEGVTELDVITIGGGGGGKDGSNEKSFGANGGTSSFGKVKSFGGLAGFGKNWGGRGGWGCTKSGGSGGAGSGCSAGGGAAGQTSKPSDLHPGSSTLPFCGTGGSSAATSCGEEFKSMPLGTSGPGGIAANGRNGAKYGGGGGSRAGGRAGGGGGYCRVTLQVKPGEKFTVTVGKGGNGYSWGRGHDGNGGDGLVVVAWAGKIKPEGPFE